MESFTIIPIGGLKTSVPEDDLTLMQIVSEGVAITNDVGGVNVDYQRSRNAANKSYGRAQWSASATTSTTNCLGLFSMTDSSDNLSQWIFAGDGGSGKGRVWRFNSSRAPQRVSSTSGAGHPGAVEWSDTDLYCAIQYGDYMIFTDIQQSTTPYYSDYNDAKFTKMLNSGTEYKCKYLELFQNRIVIANTDQTNGDLEIRWSAALPTLGSMAIAAGNQLFKSGNDSITGLKKFGPNACFIYGEDSVDRIDYYSSYLVPFGITNMAGQGTVSYHSIVDIGPSHYLFNKSYGFCEYRGGSEFPYGGRAISDPIEDMINGISSNYYKLIVGTFLPSRNEIAWAVPLASASTNNAVLYYNIQSGSWRKEDKVAHYVDAWRSWTDFTWNDLIIALGGSGALWTAAGTDTWAKYTSERYDTLILSNTDGQLYEYSSEGDAGSDFDGYRIEPMLNFQKNNKSVVNEIWFSIAERGTYSIDIYYRQGDNVGDVKAASWTALGSISTDNPSNAVVYTPDSLHSAARYHQIKWGCDAAAEPFSVNSIQFRYVPEGRY